MTQQQAMKINGVKTIFSALRDNRLTVLFGFEFILNPGQPNVRVFSLLTVVSSESRHGDHHVRQLFVFDPQTGMQTLSAHQHPFTSCGTVMEHRKEYEEVHAFIKEWFEDAENNRLLAYWDAATLAQELTAPESDAERPS